MKRKALFVGINDYNDEKIANLSFAVADATALYGAFQTLGFETKVLNDWRTTIEGISNAFLAFTSDLEPGDAFFFYFAGHGYTREDKQILVTRDTPYATIGDEGGGLACNSLNRMVERRGCHSIFVLDACRSNILASDVRGEDDFLVRDLLPMAKLVHASEHGGSMVVMRSCKTGQRAHEVKELEHGLYTAALLNVLGSRRKPDDKLVFDDALNGEIEQAMRRLAKQCGLKDDQTPEFGKPESCPDLPCVWEANGPMPAVLPAAKPRKRTLSPVVPDEATDALLHEAVHSVWTLCSDTLNLPQNREDAALQKAFTAMRDVSYRIYEEVWERRRRKMTVDDIWAMIESCDELKGFIRERFQGRCRDFRAQHVLQRVQDAAENLKGTRYAMLAEAMVPCVQRHF